MSDPIDPTTDRSGPTGSATTVPVQDTPVYTVRRHPYRGFLAAIPLALGLTIILLVTKVISLALTPMIAVIVVVLVLGTLWGTFGPASKPSPSDAPPAVSAPAPADAAPTPPQAPPPTPAAPAPDGGTSSEPEGWKPPTSDT